MSDNLDDPSDIQPQVDPPTAETGSPARWSSWRAIGFWVVGTLLICWIFPGIPKAFRDLTRAGGNLLSCSRPEITSEVGELVKAQAYVLFPGSVINYGKSKYSVKDIRTIPDRNGDSRSISCEGTLVIAVYYNPGVGDPTYTATQHYSNFEISYSARLTDDGKDAIVSLDSLD